MSSSQFSVDSVQL